MPRVPEPRDRRIPDMPWWGAFLVTVLMMVSMWGVFFAAAALKAAARGISFAAAADLTSRDMLIIGLAQAAGVGLAIFAGVRLFAPEGRLRETLGVATLPRWPVLAFAAVAGLALQFPLTELANVLRALAPGTFAVSVAEQHQLQRMLSPGTLGATMIAVASAAVIAPASEELMFRGLILGGVRTRHGAFFAVLLSSVLFGVSHRSPLMLVYAATAGVIFAIVA